MERKDPLKDLSYNTIVKIESGESKNPTIKTVAGIAKALGVSMDGLIKSEQIAEIL